MDRFDFDNEGQNYFLFRYNKEDFVLKEASSESVAVSRDFRLNSCEYEIKPNEDGTVNGSPKNLGKQWESSLIMVMLNVYHCDKEHPEDSDKATRKVSEAYFRSWPDRVIQSLNERLGKMSGLTNDDKIDEQETKLGNSPTP